MGVTAFSKRYLRGGVKKDTTAQGVGHKKANGDPPEKRGGGNWLMTETRRQAKDVACTQGVHQKKKVPYSAKCREKGAKPRPRVEKGRGAKKHAPVGQGANRKKTSRKVDSSRQ